MGGASSRRLDFEKTSWAIPHRLNYVDDLRNQQLQLIQKFDSRLRLCFTDRTTFGYQYQHWWITDGNWILEYGGGDNNRAGVLVHCNPRQNYIIDTEFNRTPEVVERMKKVCGATNYSLALRNCEHLARYVHCGAWISFQMVGAGKLKGYLRDNVLGPHTKMVNTFPEELKPQEMARVPIYPDVRVKIRFTQNKSALTSFDEEAYNVVILGPSGSGKSTLINNLFNLTVCETGGTAMSVTREVKFYRGKYSWKSEDQGDYTNIVNIIDTLGFCDSSMSASDVLDAIKSSVKVNLTYIDKVVVVCSGRIEASQADAINQFLKWLSFTGYRSRFVFVYNKADQSSQEERMKSLLHMCSTFGADTTQSNSMICGDGDHSIKMNLATGFPPGAAFEQIKEDHTNLTRSVLCEVKPRTRIPVNKESCTIL